MIWLRRSGGVRGSPGALRRTLWRAAPLGSALAAGMVVGALAGGLGMPCHLQAGADPALDTVNRASRAAAEVDFTGMVRITWISQGRGAPSSAEVPVQASGGRVTVGALAGHGGSVGRAGSQGAGGSGGAGSVDEAVTTWFHSPELGPAVTSKYQLSSAGQGQVVGRPVDIVEYRLHGKVVERLHSDRETGLALRRESMDEDGRPVRTIEFTKVSTTTTVGRPVAAVAVHPNLSTRPGQRAPLSLPNGYQLVDVTTHDGVSQAAYSDGLRTVSIFEQRGAMDGIGSVKLAAVSESVADGPAKRYGWAGGTMVVWSDGRVTVAVVGDGPQSDVVAAARAVPERRPSFQERVAEGGRRIIELLA